MKKLIILLMVLILCASVFALNQPAKPDTEIEGDISATGSTSIQGTSCTNLYETTGDYCSGHLRIYYQCLPTLDGGQWEQRTEDCESYGGRCSELFTEAKCVDYPTSSPRSKIIIAVSILFLIISALLIVFSKKMFKKAWAIPLTIGILLAILALWTIFTVIVGGI